MNHKIDFFCKSIKHNYYTRYEKMLIFVKCITYGYFGESGHLFTVNSADTLKSFKDKIVEHFHANENIEIFDDSTEQILDSYDSPLRDCFSSSTPFHSITFSE